MSIARLPNAKSSYWAPSIRIYAIYSVHFKRRYAHKWKLTSISLYIHIVCVLCIVHAYVCGRWWVFDFMTMWIFHLKSMHIVSSVKPTFSTLNFCILPFISLGFHFRTVFFLVSFLFRIIYFMWWNTWTVVIWCFTFKFRDALPNIKQNSLAPKSYRDWNFYIRWESFIGMCNDIKSKSKEWNLKK